MKFAEQRALRLAGTPYRLVRFVFSQHCSPLPSGSGCRVDGWLASHPRALNSMSKPCQATMFVWPCLSTPRRHRHDHHDHHHHHRHRRHHPRPVLVLIAMTIFRTIFIMILLIITTMIIIILITNPIVIGIAILTVIIVIIITTTIITIITIIVITIIVIIVIVIIITIIIITTTATASSTTTTIITIFIIIIIIVVIILIAMVIILIVIVIVLFLLTAIVVVIITTITIIIITILLTIITIIISIIIMHAPSTGYQWATWSVAVFRQNRRSQVALGRAGALDSSWIAPRLDIIHVDIKPANLFLTETGRFKPAAWLHHVQPVGDAQGSASRYRGRGNCRYVGEAARRACDADCLIKGFAPLQDVVFETTGPPPIHSAQPCHVQAVADRGPRTYGHSCMHLTALGLTSRWSRFSGTSSMSRFGPWWGAIFVRVHPSGVHSGLEKQLGS